MIRKEKFQQDLLKKRVYYEEHDRQGVYMEAFIMDGSSVNFLFGKKEDRIEEFDKKMGIGSYGRKFVILGAKVLRTRFDLLYDTDEMKELSVKWMFAFSEKMAELNGQLSHLEILYFTSHTLESQIEIYSKFDLPFIMTSFAVLVLFYVLFVIIDGRLLNRIFSCKWASGAQQQDSSSTLEASTDSQAAFNISLSTELKMKAMLIMVCFLKVFFTSLATIGLMALISFDFNMTLVTLFIALLFINLNQTLVLIKNLNGIEKVASNAAVTKQSPAISTELKKLIN